MRYKTHIAGGLALGYVAFNNIELININLGDSETMLVVTAGLILGSLFPDIDTASSYLSNKTKILSFFTSKLFKHRGFTHSIVGSVTLSMVVYFILKATSLPMEIVNKFSIAFYIGIVSHILLDIVTPGGVVLLYPFSHKRIRTWRSPLYRFTSWNIPEFILVLAFLAIAFKALINNF